MNIYMNFRQRRIQRAAERNIRRMKLGMSEQEMNAFLRRNQAHNAIAWLLIVLGICAVLFAAADPFCDTIGILSGAFK